jgi:hypothetical protein
MRKSLAERWVGCEHPAWTTGGHAKAIFCVNTAILLLTMVEDKLI